MSYLLSSTIINDLEIFGSIALKGDYLKQNNKLLIQKGFVAGLTIDGIFDLIIKEGFDCIRNFVGVFSLVFYDDDTKTISVVNDKLGREIVFYYRNEEQFLVSDDFWEIVNIIEPTDYDLDVQSVKELAVFWYPLFNKTIIKKLEFLPPGTIITFSTKDKKLTKKQYWDFKYHPNNSLSLSDATDRLYDALDNGIKSIKQCNKENSIYGVGLSGGIDSRLIPYFCQKNNMHLRSFIIGEKRPHLFVLSRDHSNARRIAKYFNLIHNEIEYNSERFLEKTFNDVRFFPIGTSEFFRYVEKDLPDFNILLNGGTGGLIIGNLPDFLHELNSDQLVEVILAYYTRLNPKVNDIKKVLQRLKNSKRASLLQRLEITGVMATKEIKKTIEKIYEFIADNNEKNNVEIFQKYLMYHVGTKSHYGMFESLLGRKKSYSIYYPFILNEVLTWTEKFIIKRRIVYNLLVRKMPLLAKIEAQDYKPAMYYQMQGKNTLKEIASGMSFLVRGKGVMKYTDWASKYSYQNYAKKLLYRKDSYFSNIFDIEKIDTLERGDNILLENLLKIKEILSILERKTYRNFLNGF